MKDNIKLLAIAGQTASGKSDLAMRIARQFDGEIICADSRTVYKTMDIATAKPTKRDQQQVRHWCLDTVNPTERFTVYDFLKAAKAAIKDINSRGKLAILVGGTGLYFDAVLYDFDFSSSSAGEKFSGLSLLELREAFKSRFGEAASADTLGNQRYMRRALETGQLPHSVSKRVLPRGVVYVGLRVPSDVLEQRIRSRVSAMLDAGLIDEVDKLSRLNISTDAVTAIAYKAFADYCKHQDTVDQAVEKFIQGDIKLAKKQMTWFKRDPNITWYESGEEAYRGLLDLLNSRSDA